MLAAWWLHLVFLSMALEDACCLVIASCFSFYGNWRCLLPGDCILFFFLWHLRMLATRWLHLVFLSMALEDACSLVIVSCFSFWSTWRCLQPDDCILLFLSMVLEDACRPMIASCFSFYGTWGCLLPGDCILLFFLWHLKMLAARWLYLVFLFGALEDACCLVIASCFSFYSTWGYLPPDDCILFFLSMALEDACCLVIASCFSFSGAWGCLLPSDYILFFFLWHLRMLPCKYLHLQFAFLWSADTFLSQISSS